MKFPTIPRPSELPSVCICGLSTAPGMPRLSSVTVLPLVENRRSTVCTYPVPFEQATSGRHTTLPPKPVVSLAPRAVYNTTLGSVGSDGLLADPQADTASAQATKNSFRCIGDGSCLVENSRGLALCGPREYVPGVFHRQDPSPFVG